MRIALIASNRVDIFFLWVDSDRSFFFPDPLLSLPWIFVKYRELYVCICLCVRAKTASSTSSLNEIIGELRVRFLLSSQAIRKQAKLVPPYQLAVSFRQSPSFLRRPGAYASWQGPTVPVVEWLESNPFSRDSSFSHFVPNVPNLLKQEFHSAIPWITDRKDESTLLPRAYDG